MIDYLTILCGYRSKGFAWFRFFGVGFVIKDVTKQPWNFSERMGLVWVLQVGNISIRPIW